jgi:hypothetical protein
MRQQALVVVVPMMVNLVVVVPMMVDLVLMMVRTVASLPMTVA